MIFGVDSRDYRSHRSVGFLPENPYFYKFLTADETAAAICGLRGTKLAARTAELLSLVGLEEARQRRVAEVFEGNAPTDRSGSGADPGSGANCP